MPYIDNTAAAAAIPVVIAQSALGYFGAYLNLAKNVSTDFNGTQFNTAGDTIKIPRLGDLTANTKAANADVVLQNPSLTSVVVTLDQHVEVTFGIDDVTRLLTNQNLMDGYARTASMKIAEKVETALFSLYSSLTGSPLVFNDTSDATKTASLLAIKQYFFNQKAPATEDIAVLQGIAMYNSLLSSPTFTQAQNLGVNNQGPEGPTSPIQTGELLEVFGLDITPSQIVPVTGAGPYTDHGIAYQKNAFMLGSRPMPTDGNGLGVRQEIVQNADMGVGLRVTSAYDSSKMALKMTLDILFGVGIIDNRLAVPVNYIHA